MVSLSQFAFLSLLVLIAIMLQGCGDEKTPDKSQEQESGKEKTPEKPQEQESCSLVADVLKFVRINGKQGWTIQDFEKVGAFISNDDFSEGTHKIPWDQVNDMGLAPTHDTKGVYLHIPLPDGFAKLLLQPSMCEASYGSGFGSVPGFPCGSVEDALSFLNINGKQHRTLAEFQKAGAYVTTSQDSDNDADKIPWDQVAKATFATDKPGPRPKFFFVVPGMRVLLSPGMCESGYKSEMTGIAGFESLAQLSKEGNQRYAQQSPSLLRGHLTKEIRPES